MRDGAGALPPRSDRAISVTAWSKSPQAILPTLPARRRKHSHPLLHLRGHLVVAHQAAAVAQPAGFTLDHEHPQRLAGNGHQCASRLPLFRRSPRAWMRGVEFSQIRKGCLQATAETPERRGLLLDDFIVQDVDGRTESIGWRHPCSLLNAHSSYIVLLNL